MVRAHRSSLTPGPDHGGKFAWLQSIRPSAESSNACEHLGWIFMFEEINGLEDVMGLKVEGR